MASRDYDDTAHGPAPIGTATKYDSARSDSAMEKGTVLGKHGSQAPLVQVEHTGELAAWLPDLNMFAQLC